MKKYIRICHLFLLLSMVIWTGKAISQEISVDFEVTRQCINYIVIENQSQSGTENPIIGYLWEIWKESGGDVIRSTEVNPVLSFEESGVYVFKLTATDKFHVIYIKEKNYAVFDSPPLVIIEWDDLVCSNADSSFYTLELREGFTYEWDLSNVPGSYIDESSGNETNRLRIVWKALEPSLGSLQFDVRCHITNTNYCEAIVSQPVILLSSSVPKSDNLQVIAKPNDKSLLFCIIDHPEDYLFEWGYVELDGNMKKFARTANNYHKYDDGIIHTYNCFVEIFNKSFTYCTTTVFYDPQKSGYAIAAGQSQSVDVLNIFPNPASDIIHIELFNNLEETQLVTVSLLNLMGGTESIHQFELKKDLSKVSLPVNSLQSGQYILRFDLAGAPSMAKRIVVINTF